MNETDGNLAVNGPSMVVETVSTEIRCHACNRLFTKVSFLVSYPEEFKALKNFSISDIFPEVEVKFQVETKCVRCGDMDYKIFVV